MTIWNSVCFMLCCIYSDGCGFCVVFTMTVVDSVCFMMCCFYNDSSGLYMYASCFVLLTMAVVDYT